MIDKSLNGLRSVLQTVAMVALMVTVFSLAESAVYASGCSASQGYVNSSCVSNQTTKCEGSCTLVTGGDHGNGPTCYLTGSEQRCLCH